MKVQVKQEEKKKNGYYSQSHPPLANNIIPYVERLLETPLTDYRKSAISLILAPYFVNVQKPSNSDSFNKIKKWTLSCNNLRGLEPSIAYFDELIDRATGRAKDTGIKPLKLEKTLRYKNRELYDLLR